ncbi:MAG: hypothetical protein KBS38_02990 [Bacteroidales bacterium]|nr:hypothetical protein [Candidatus Cacconaster caballi]
MKNLGRIKKGVIDFASGDLLIRKGFDKQLGFVFYIFCCLCLFIMWSLMVESQLARIEDNKRILKDLKINYQQRTLDLVGMNNRTKVDELLKKNNSTLHGPVDPPAVVKIK